MFIDLLARIDKLVTDFLMLAVVVGAIYVIGSLTLYISDKILTKIDKK